MTKRIWNVCLVFCLLICLPGGALTGSLDEMILHTQAAEMDYIRVGLKNRYEKVSELTLQNTALSFGYCIDNVYYPEETIYSDNGFTLQPESGSWSVYQGTYRSYATAVKDAALIRSMYGVTMAYPASTGKGSWKIYIPTSVLRSSNTSGNLSGVAGLFSDDTGIWSDLPGLSSGSLLEKMTTITRSSAHMLLVTSRNGTFLIDAELAGSYPQFAPVAGTNEVPVIKISGGTRSSVAGSYRGRMEIGRYGNSGVTAVNVLPLEQYLYGVVPSEMSYSWPAEALKAQAVCARGYALMTAGPGSSGTLTKGYKISDTTLHQAYGGYRVEHQNTTGAVNATKGETVCYENQVVKTYYFSTSGGSTEAVEDVWGSNISYLRAVSDIYESNPAKQPWLVTMTKQEILSRIPSRNIGTILSIKPEIRTQSGRIYSLKIEGTKGSVTLEQDQIRSVLGLYSTKFQVVAYGDIPDKVSVLSADGMTERRISQSYVISGSGKAEKLDPSLEQAVVLSADNRTGFALKGPNSKDSYIFAGTGYGHGVGMSQSGARGMAEEGYTYKEILTHYFTGTTVQ